MMRTLLTRLTRFGAITAAVLLPLFVPAYAQQKAANRQAPPDIASSIKAVEAMAEVDHDMISRGSAPPILLEYDKELLALITEGADIRAKHDEVRGRQLGAKISAIMAARDLAQKPYETASRERAKEASARAAEAKALEDTATAQVNSRTRRPSGRSGGDQGWCQQGSGSATPGGYVPC